MRPARVLVIVLAFCVDVRVKAAGHDHVKDCWGHRIPCAIDAGEHRRELTAKEFSLVMSPRSIMEQRSDKEVRLVRGTFYVSTASNIRLSTPYVRIRCASECKALIERNSGDVIVKALTGDWVARRQGDTQDYAIRGGTQANFAEVDSRGKAQMEFPASLPWEDTLRQWAGLYPGSREAFRADAQKFRAEWKAGNEEAGRLTEEAAARVLASHEEGLAKERARRKAVAEEEAQLRRLFREKNNIDP